jgi:hypothetical protein
MSLQRSAYMSQEIPVDYNELKNGTPEQVKEQLNTWITSRNPSIFIQFIPDEMDEEGLRKIFSPHGPIDRVEFVPKKTAEGKQIGRMVFIHFNHFSRFQLPTDIVSVHPEPWEIPLSITKSNSNRKIYTLKCRINVRPIQRVEYTTSQLTDMFESLNDRVMTQMTNFVQSKDELAEQVKDLALSLAKLKRMVVALALPIAPGLP